MDITPDRGIPESLIRRAFVAYFAGASENDIRTLCIDAGRPEEAHFNMVMAACYAQEDISRRWGIW